MTLFKNAAVTFLVSLIATAGVLLIGFIVWQSVSETAQVLGELPETDEAGQRVETDDQSAQERDDDDYTEVDLVQTFDECVASGAPVMESYPRQCRANGETFVENIGNVLEKADLIRLTSVEPNQEVTSPLLVRGEARGYWFFEATFPVVLTNWDGLIIAEGYATALDSWMTEEFVPFEATLTFETPDLYNRGSLILQKSNASGLPEHDDALEIPIRFVLP